MRRSEFLRWLVDELADPPDEQIPTMQLSDSISAAAEKCYACEVLPASLTLKQLVDVCEVSAEPADNAMAAAGYCARSCAAGQGSGWAPHYCDDEII